MPSSRSPGADAPNLNSLFDHVNEDDLHALKDAIGALLSVRGLRMLRGDISLNTGDLENGSIHKVTFILETEYAKKAPTRQKPGLARFILQRGFDAEAGSGRMQAGGNNQHVVFGFFGQAG